ncbi:MAG: hypothetical protein AB7I34_15210 [Rhizobiaceae bacterium]
MDIRLAARLLGGNIVRRDTVCCPGPGHSRNDRSLTVTFRGGDFLVHSFSNDDWQLCRDHVRAVLGLGSFQPSERQPAYLATHVTVIAEPEPEAVKRRDFALSLWSDAKAIGGTIAERYLVGRGYSRP